MNSIKFKRDYQSEKLNNPFQVFFYIIVVLSICGIPIAIGDALSRLSRGSESVNTIIPNLLITTLICCTLLWCVLYTVFQEFRIRSISNAYKNNQVLKERVIVNKKDIKFTPSRAARYPIQDSIRKAANYFLTSSTGYTYDVNEEMYKNVKIGDEIEVTKAVDTNIVLELEILNSSSKENVSSNVDSEVMLEQELNTSYKKSRLAGCLEISIIAVIGFFIAIVVSVLTSIQSRGV